jgi:hypothetical protein
MKREGSGSISQRHGSADPDPHQNVMDPQHRYNLFRLCGTAVWCAGRWSGSHAVTSQLTCRPRISLNSGKRRFLSSRSPMNFKCNFIINLKIKEPSRPKRSMVWLDKLDNPHGQRPFL